MDLQSTFQGGIGSFETKSGLLSDEMQACIGKCIQCAQMCDQLLQYCLKKGGAHAEASHIRMLQDCSDICFASARFMTRSSEFHSRTCAVCAEVCTACAADCDRMSDDDMMKACADVCRRCAESCQKMARAH